MLERAAFFVEPASQALLHSLEPPVRSHRLLGRGFFRHGVHLTEPPTWWPIYLNSIRQVPTPTSGLRRVRAKPRKRAVVAHPPVGPGRASRVRAELRPGHPVLDASANRAYSASHIQGQQPGLAREEAGEDLDEGSIPYNDDNIRETAPEADVQVEEQGSGLSQKSKAEQRLAELIGAGSDLYIDDPSMYQEAWDLFVALEDQTPFASPMTRFLATSTTTDNLDRALQCFDIIPMDDRSKFDYDLITEVAIRRRRTSLMFRFCREATDQGLGELCRQTALLSLLNLKLWKTAAQLFESCWDTEARWHPQAHSLHAQIYLPRSSLTIIDDSQEVPRLVTNLCTRLRRQDALLNTTDRGNLTKVVLGLSWRLVASPKLMAIVTLEGLLKIFDDTQELSLLSSEHIQIAVRTLASGDISRNRHDLAIALYRNAQLRYPLSRFHPDVLHGLLYLCCKAGEGRAALEYVLHEIKKCVTKELLPSRDDFTVVLRTLAEQGDVAAVEALHADFVEIHGRMREAKEVVPLLYVHAVTGDVANTRKAFDGLRDKFGAPGTVCWNVLMLAHARSHNPHQAFNILDDMLNNGIVTDAYTYSTLISLCARVGDTSTLLSLLDIATRTGLRDLRVMLADLVHAYCLNDEVEKADAMLENLGDFDFDGSPVVIWNTLLRYHAYKSKPADVLEVQSRMKLAGVEPDEMTYGILMVTLMRMRKTSQAADLLRSMHLGTTISATPFLYALILHGFRKEGNRNMVNILYREMRQRFPLVSPSAELSMLRSQQERGFAQTRQQILKNRRSYAVIMDGALSFLEDISGNISHGRIQSGPQPGFERRRAHAAVPDAYSSSVVDTLSMYGRAPKAANLLGYGTEKVALTSGTPESIHTLTTRLLVATKNFEWDLVDQLWATALETGFRASVPILQARALPTQLLLPLRAGQSTFECFQKLRDLNVEILPAQRFILMVPITRYLQALDSQHRHSDMVATVDQLRNLGWELSGSNWNVYVQCLCRSPDPAHQLRAFAIFEEVLLPRMPSYRLLIEGRWTNPVNETKRQRQGLDPVSSVSRRMLEHLLPNKPIPSYLTAVHLARVILDFQELAQAGNDKYLRVLKRAHFPAYGRIRSIPFQKDRAQRLLLVQKKAYGPVIRPSRSLSPKMQLHEQKGILQPSSTLHALPTEELDLVLSTLRARKGENGKQWSDPEAIVLAERFLGQIPQGSLWLDGEDRWEMGFETRNRIKTTEQEYLDIINDLQEAVDDVPMVMDDEAGDVTFRPSWSEYGPSGGQGPEIPPADEKTPPAATTKTTNEYKEASPGVGNESHSDKASSLSQHQSAVAPQQGQPATTRYLTPQQMKAFRRNKQTVPRPHVKRQSSLYDQLLPPKFLPSPIDEAFQGAKAQRKVRVDQLVRHQAYADAQREVDAATADEWATAVRDRETLPRFEREETIRQREQALQEAQEAQARRVESSDGDEPRPSLRSRLAAARASRELGQDFAQSAVDAVLSTEDWSADRRTYHPQSDPAQSDNPVGGGGDASRLSGDGTATSKVGGASALDAEATRQAQEKKVRKETKNRKKDSKKKSEKTNDVDNEVAQEKPFAAWKGGAEGWSF